MDHYLSETLRHRHHIPRPDASLEAIRVALFGFMGIPDPRVTDEQISRDVEKSTFAKSKMPMDEIWNIEKDATRRIAKRKAGK